MTWVFASFIDYIIKHFQRARGVCTPVPDLRWRLRTLATFSIEEVSGEAN